jgi:ADP-ribosyl-[dinitrogen reductase] hydrolase
LLIGNDPADLMERFCAWHERGEYSCGCHDIGITVSGALSRWRTTDKAFAGSTDPNTAGNGSLMRLAPVAVAHWNDHAKLLDVAARQSRTTHGAPEAISACIGYAEMLADAIAGKPRSDVMAPRQGGFPGKIAAIMAGSWRGRRRGEIQSSGYVAHSLEASLWTVGRADDFRSAVLLAANLGGWVETPTQPQPLPDSWLGLSMVLPVSQRMRWTSSRGAIGSSTWQSDWWRPPSTRTRLTDFCRSMAETICRAHRLNRQT